MPPDLRIPRNTGGDRITVWHNGRPVHAREGQRLTSALWAQGRTVLSRSMRYHRARGLFCGTGECSHCLLNINGQPNVRACQTTCRPGLWAEDQNAWPTVQHDALAASDLVYRRYLDAHKSFIRPRGLWPVFQRAIRAMAGYGTVPKSPVAQRYTHHHETCDVLVVGAGPAGLTAARAAADGGADVLLLERQDTLGGRVRHTDHPDGHDQPAPVEDWIHAIQSDGVRTHRRTRLVGLYPDQPALAVSSSRAITIDAATTLLTPGARDAYPTFPGSDRAGVLLPSAAQHLMARDHVLPGRRPVFLGDGPRNLSLAQDLQSHGVAVERIVSTGNPTNLTRFQQLGIDVIQGAVPVAVEGRRTFKRLVLERAGGGISITGDVLIAGLGTEGRVELAQQAGVPVHHVAGQGFVATTEEDGSTTVPGTYVAGAAAGTRDWTQSADQGAAAGQAAAREATQ